MEQAAHTVSSHSKGLQPVHNQGLVTLDRVMPRQVPRDIQWECKAGPLEAWGPCRMVHRYYLSFWIFSSDLSLLLVCLRP